MAERMDALGETCPDQVLHHFPRMESEEDKVERHDVLKKLNRAAVAVLATAGLTLTGLAPAAALDGDPIAQNSSGLTAQNSAVARVEVLRKGEYEQNKWGIALAECTGVLLDDQHIATIKQCISSNTSPYDFSQKTPSEVNGFPVRVTFGPEVLPSGKSGKDPEKVFWVSSIKLDPRAATQVVIARLDRKVPANVATPVKVVDSGVNGNMSGTGGTFFGWRPFDGMPQMSALQTKLPITKLVNDMTASPRSKVQQWNQWRESHPSFKDDKELGTIGWESVRKGWEDPENITVIPKDIGAPVIDSKGTLVGIHVGKGIILDAQQTDFTQFLNSRPVGADEILVPNPASEGAALDAMKIIQKALCGTPVVPAGGVEDSIDGQPVEIRYLDKSSTVKPTKVIEGVKITDTRKDDTFESAVASGSTTDPTVRKSNDGTLASTFVGKVGGQARPELYKYNMGTTNTTTDGMKVTGSNCASGDIGKDSMLGLYNDMLNNFNSMATEIKDLQAKEKAQNEKKVKYDNIVAYLTTALDNLKNYNSPNIEADYDNTPNYYGRLPQWIKDDIKFEYPDDPGNQKVIKTGFKDGTAQEPAKGADLKKWLNDATKEVTFELQRYTEEAQQQAANLETATKAVASAQMNQGWAQGLYDMATTAKNAFNTQAVARQNEWQTEVKNQNDSFVTDYNTWADDLFTLRKSANEAKKQELLNRDKLSVAQNKLAQIDPDTNPDAYAKASDAVNSAQAAYDTAVKSREAADTGVTAKLSKKPNPLDSKYVPKVDKLAPKLADLANQMPNYLLNIANAKHMMELLKNAMQGKVVKDQGEIDQITDQIEGYYNRAVAAQPDIMRRQIRIGDMLTAARNALATAPASLKPQLRTLVSDMERHAGRADTAANTVLGATDQLKSLWERARKSSDPELSRKLLMQAQSALGMVDDPIKASQVALEEATGTDTMIKGIMSGKTFEEVIKENKMTPEEKAKAEAEKKKKEEEALRKKVEEELLKKYGIKPGTEGSGTGNGKTDTRPDKKAAADEKRLAKALSKNTLRAEGSNRVLTSIAAWKMGKFPGDSLVLVDGNLHPDGLSATPFAAALKAPILLTTWKTGLEPALMDQIKTSGKKNLYLVGGQVPLTPYDQFELEDAGITVTRIAGPDRYATSVAVNRAAESLVGAAPQKPLELFVADGISYPDALVAGAAAGRKGALMLISKGNVLDPQTYGYISQLGQTRPLKITAVGGPAARAVQNTPWPTTFGVEIQAIYGADRYETAAQLATTQPGTTAAVLATGEDFPDALSGGALAADQNAAMLLTKTKNLPDSSYQALRRHGSEKTIVVGGPNAVSAKVAELVNGARLGNEASKVISGTLAESEKIKADAAAAAEKAKADALKQVAEALKGSDSKTLAALLSQLGLGSVDDLKKLYDTAKSNDNATR